MQSRGCSAARRCAAALISSVQLRCGAFASAHPAPTPRLLLCSMYTMHKKVSARERIVGFYSTGPKIRPADIDIDALIRGR